MTVVKKQATTQAVEAEVITAERVKLLEGFAQLTAERFGYFIGRRLNQQEMTEKLKPEMESVRHKRKAIIDNIEQFLETPEAEIHKAIETGRDELEVLMKDLKEKRKPFQEKINPLAKAVRYMDSVVLPESLKELGYAPAPRFQLEKWIVKDLAEKARKKE